MICRLASQVWFGTRLVYVDAWHWLKDCKYSWVHHVSSRCLPGSQDIYGNSSGQAVYNQAAGPKYFIERWQQAWVCGSDRREWQVLELVYMAGLSPLAHMLFSCIGLLLVYLEARFMIAEMRGFFSV